jgi:hypothetical protein
VLLCSHAKKRSASDWPGRGDIFNGRTFIVTLSIPPMDFVELVTASAISGVKYETAKFLYLIKSFRAAASDWPAARP